MGKGLVRADDLHRVLDVEVRKLKSGSDSTRLLDMATLFPTFGFENVVLINLQMPQASWVAHAQTWHQLGRRVRTEQAIRILKLTRSRAAALGAVGREYGADGLIEQELTGLRVNSVYDVTATQGPPVHLPRPPVTANDAVARRLWDGLAREASADGFAVDVRPTGDGSEGFTDHDAKRIVIADHLDDFRAVTRLVLEVADARLQSSALAAPATVQIRGMREVEADSVAYMVLAHHGISMETKSFEQIADWAKSVDTEAQANVIKVSGARVVNTARQLVDSTSNHLKAHRRPLDPSRALTPHPAPDPDGLVL